MEDEKLYQALEKVRRDDYRPWRYLFFTFINGIAWGLGMALGMTIVLGLVIYFLTKILSRLIDFPVIGAYIGELMKILDAYIKQGTKIR